MRRFRGNRAVNVIPFCAGNARSALSCVASRQVYVSSGNGGTSLIGSQQAYAISQVQPQLEPVSLDFGAGGLTAITPQSLQSVQTALERIEQVDTL